MLKCRIDTACCMSRPQSTCFGGTRNQHNSKEIISYAASRVVSHPYIHDGRLTKFDDLCENLRHDCHTREIKQPHDAIHSQSKSRRHCHRMTEEGGEGIRLQGLAFFGNARCIECVPSVCTALHMHYVTGRRRFFTVSPLISSNLRQNRLSVLTKSWVVSLTLSPFFDETITILHFR